ncbi:MAG: hypothetical protein MUC49_03945 [Raineya sp.]|jgi:hypothetical protein|nr:hypothetical protein [Raineya sp.]
MKAIVFILSIMIFTACGSENKKDNKTDTTKVDTKKDSIRTEPEKKVDTSSKVVKDTSGVKITPETIKEEP